MVKMSKQGYTIVEIMIVTGIILLLAAILVPNYLRARINANDATAQNTLKAISTAMENYFAINSSYPGDTDDLIGEKPPYLNEDYFIGTHNGFSFFSALTSSAYSVSAVPIDSRHGSRSFTISTVAVLESD